MKPIVWTLGCLGRGLARTLLLALLAGVSGVACDHSDASKNSGSSLVTDELPKDLRHSEIDFDGKVRLLGYKLNTRGPMRPGRNVTATLYWRVDKKLEAGYRVFTRLLDASGESVANLDDAGPLREQRDGKPVLPADAWEPGKIYVDQLTFNVPRGVKTNKVQLVAGFFKGDERLKVASGASTDTSSGLVLTAPTGVRPRNARPTPVPSLRIDKLDPKVKIKIDGKLDEDAWKEAPIATFVDVNTGEPAHYLISGNVRLLWNKDGFYVGAELKDDDLEAGFKPDEKDPHLWTKDALEMMIDPDGDGDNVDYYEVQINPQNLVFDTQYDSYNEPHTDPDGPFGHQEWSSGVKSAVVVSGTIDKSDDKDDGYTIEAFFPWKAFSKAKKVPPAIGDSWRMNFYAVQDSKHHSVSWSPILRKGNFHKASRFGRVIWAEKGWTEPPAPAASAEPAGAEEAEGAPNDEKETPKAVEAPAPIKAQASAAPLKPAVNAAAPAPSK